MKRKYAVLLIDFVIAVAFGTSLLSYPAISAPVAQELRLSNTQTGFIISVFSIAYALMQVPGGYLVDRYGPARTLIVSSFIMGVGPLILVANTSLAAALASRVVAGIAGGVVYPASIRLVSVWFPRQELDKAMSLYGTSYGFFQIVAAGFLPVLILQTDWKPPLIFVSVFSFVAAALVIPILGWQSKLSDSADNAKRVKIDARGIFTRNLATLTLPNFAGVLIIMGVFSWASRFLTSSGSFSATAAGAIVAAIGTGNMVGSYFGGVFDKKIGKRKTIILSMILAIIFPIMLGLSHTILSSIVTIFGVGIGGSLYFAADFALIPFASKQGIQAAGVTFGVFNTLSNIGTFTAPVLVGFILDSTASFSLAFSTLGGIASVGLLGAYLLRVSPEFSH